MSNESPLALMTPEFQERVKAFKGEWYQKYKEISEIPTPQVDGEGRKIIKKRPDNKDYIDDAWMSAMLNKHFPGWSWERAGGITFLGSEWICADGELVIIDESLIAFGINPPVRRYWAGDAVRIQFKKDMPHIPENIIDVGDNVQSAITGAKKRAINRLCGIGDDVYGKRMEEEGAGTYETILETTGEAGSFLQLLGQYKILASEACKILRVTDLREVSDYALAWAKIKVAKGIK